MKRIHPIDLKHFKAFQDTPPIELEGKNLLLYGPNGSGKSSIFWALYTFLQSSQKPPAEVQKYFDPSHRESLVNIDMAETMKSGKPYQTHLDPPPGPPSDGHGNFFPRPEWQTGQPKLDNWPSHIRVPKGVFTQSDDPCGMSGGNTRKP